MVNLMPATLARYACVALIGSVVGLMVACKPTAVEGIQNADIIFQTSQSPQSQAIQLATHSPYSHVGIIFFKQDKAYVFEAKATVGFTPLEEWIQRGVGGHYVVKRLNNLKSIATEQTKGKVIEFIKKYKGRPYDFYFEWSDEKIYCSELVWKMYDKALGVKLGELQKLGEFDLSKPAVQAKLHERFGDQIPLNEEVISPAAIFDSKQLVTVKTQ